MNWTARQRKGCLNNRIVHTCNVFKQLRISPFARPTSVVNALESARRPSYSHMYRSRFVTCMSAGLLKRIMRACWRSLVRADE
jgi:hypothetical protein